MCDWLAEKLVLLVVGVVDVQFKLCGWGRNTSTPSPALSQVTVLYLDGFTDALLHVFLDHSEANCQTLMWYIYTYDINFWDAFSSKLVPPNWRSLQWGPTIRSVPWMFHPDSEQLRIQESSLCRPCGWRSGEVAADAVSCRKCLIGWSSESTKMPDEWILEKP